MAKSKELTPAKRRRLAELTQGFRGIVLFLFVISGMINVLALTGSVYMMQIYDRALTSGSIPTLVVLSALAIGLYLFQGGFDSSWEVDLWGRVLDIRGIAQVGRQ